jgi:hypothetical protein
MAHTGLQTFCPIFAGVYSDLQTRQVLVFTALPP